jgi:hypothetical protein
MISIAATRRSATSLLVAKHFKSAGGAHHHHHPVRLLSSMPLKEEDTINNNNNNNQTTQRRGLVSKASPQAANMMADPLTFEVDMSTRRDLTSTSLMNRFKITAEVTISKIFPAGFGWQSASVLATGPALGFGTESLNFALMTGFGDAIGVFGGHTAFYAAKKALLKADDIDMEKEVHTGILLGSAAFCSGTAWQPIVNALQGLDLPFQQVFLGTWLGCGAAFYVGLRVGRTMLSDTLQHIHEPTYDNSKNDLSLSASIGGATGFFVGTDTAYLPDQNFLINIVGIQPGTSNLMGAAIAGSSTSLGFMSAQSIMNVTYPKGKCWND